jgi:enoyl-CoA hydratase/carnithine racemase
MSLETMNLTIDGPIARLTFNRPEVLNAMDLAWPDEFLEVTDAIARSPEAQVVVIRGAGRAFCSGIDLKVLARGEFPLEWFRKVEIGLANLERLDKIVIAAIHGYCIGGGLQVALASDIRVATRSTRFGLTAIKEGLVPGMGTWRLPRYVGWGRAKRLILSGETIPAPAAEAMGLVDYLADDDEFEPRVKEITATFLSAASSPGEREAKQLVNQAFDLAWPEGLENYMAGQARALGPRLAGLKIKSE